MKPSLILKELEILADSLKIKIIKEKGNFKGGYCLLKEEKIIVINNLNPLEQRIRALTRAFSQLDISDIYIKPVIRNLIDLESKIS